MFKAFVLIMEEYVAACRNKEYILMYFFVGSFAVGKYSLRTSRLETFISFVIPTCLYASKSMQTMGPVFSEIRHSRTVNLGLIVCVWEEWTPVDSYEYIFLNSLRDFD
jgi:hypothetical protein